MIEPLDRAQRQRVDALYAAAHVFTGEDRPMSDVVEAAHYILSGMPLPIDDRFVNRAVS